MSITVAVIPSIAGPASRYILEHPQVSLSDSVEQLAGLRLSIAIAARWESPGILDGHTRAELQDDLRRLRSRYLGMIDEIAMNYGVQAAIEAKEGVEREVKVPKNMAPPRHSEAEGFHDV